MMNALKQKRPASSERPGGVAGRRPWELILRARRALEERGASLSSLVVVALLGLLGMIQVASNVPLVLVLLAVVFYEFQKRLDQGLPLMQVAALLGVLQWTVGPLLSYSTGWIEGRYAMYVAEPVYFSYALPGTAAYVIGLLAVGSSVRQREMLRFFGREHFVPLGVVFNLIGLGARLAAPGVPGGLAFAIHLLSQLGYVGAIYFMFSRSVYRWPLIVLSMLPLVKTSAESAMFHDVILWGGLIFCYWFGLRRHEPLAKAGLLLLTGWLMFTVQAIKQDYRNRVWQGEEASLIDQALEFWSSAESALSRDVVANVIVRLNQGWIVSAVMARVPDEEPFAEGGTLKEAVVAALLPRMVAENKAVAGGKANFRKFTGLPLEESTSMAISPLGEAYANFGRAGGVALMLGFGLAFAGFYGLCLRWTVSHPTFLFWLPLIFYQAIKAETEFVTVLNQLTKGSVVAFALHWLMDVKGFAALLRREGGAPGGRRRVRRQAGKRGADLTENGTGGE
jgi:hypothetical protein